MKQIPWCVLGQRSTCLLPRLIGRFCAQTEILTPFPRTSQDYASVSAPVSPSGMWPSLMRATEPSQVDVLGSETSTIRDLYDPLYWQTKRRQPETLQSLQVQITAIHERASRLSPAYLAGGLHCSTVSRAFCLLLTVEPCHMSPSSSTDPSLSARESFWQKVAIVEFAITSFMSGDLPPLRNEGLMGEIPPLISTSPVNGTIFLIHTLAYLAIIQLHNSMAAEIAQSYDQVLGAARGVLKLAQVLLPTDYAEIGCEVVLSVSLGCCFFFHDSSARPHPHRS